jgi:multiple sugar transport system substrate-binding protein
MSGPVRPSEDATGGVASRRHSAAIIHHKGENMRQLRNVVAFLVMLGLSTVAFATAAQEEAAEMEERQITLWTTEEQPERLDVQRSVNSGFTEQTGIATEVVPVTENQMGERVTAAFSAGELPDVIFHPLNFALTWYESGILDATAAAEVINELGENTFGAGALNLVETDDGYASVPLSGWTQLLVYRQDLFQEAGLDPPTDYASIRAALDELHSPPDMYGFVAATDPSQVYMMQVFEHVALANGATLVDAEGNVDVMGEEWTQTLEFYKELAEASPPGNLYWQQSRELYFAGDAAMIIWSPFIMDELAGLRDSVPVTAFDDPTSRALADATSFITKLAGPSKPDGSAWTEVAYLGITVDADTDAAQQFVGYSLDEGYIDTLGMAAEGKFPVRSGTPSDTDRFVDGWSGLEVGVDRSASLGDIYGAETIDRLLEGFETGSRWGFAEGYGSLTSQLYETRVIAELVREYIDGERTVQETQEAIQEEVESLMGS